MDGLAHACLQEGAYSATQNVHLHGHLNLQSARRHLQRIVVEYNGSEVWVAKNWGRGLQFHALATMAEEAMLRHAHSL